MATHVLRNTETQYIIKIMNENSFTITKAAGEHNSVVPTGYKIAGIFWSVSTSGNEHLEITRGATEVIDLHGSGNWSFAGEFFQLDDDDTVDITVAPTNTGHHYSLILKLRKVI